MEDLKELKLQLSDELEESFRRGIIKSMPRVPMIIIYTDTEALKAKREIDSILSHIWGDRKNGIVQIAMNEGGFLDTDSAESMEAYMVQEMIDDMYASENWFRDMSRLCAVFVHATTSCGSAADFQKRFNYISQIEKYTTDGLMTTGIILLDESTKCRDTGREIRKYLGALLEQNSNPYASMFLLSNRLSNGSLLAGSRIKENYKLAGWIILLLNSVGKGYAPDLSLFYPINREYYLTAAFSEVNRPNEAICDIVLHTILIWIDRQMRSQGNVQNRNLSIEDLYQKLGISGNRAEFLEAFFDQNIGGKIPDLNAVRYLPRQHIGEMDIAAKDFRSLDEETMGGCSAMLAAVSSFDDRMKNDFVGFVQSYIRSRLSPAEVEHTLTAANIRELLGQVHPVELTGRERVDVYMREKVHADYLNHVLPVCAEVLKIEQENAAAHAQEFEGVLQEFQQGYFPNDEELERYYTDITNNELNGASGGLGMRLMKEMGIHGNNRNEILDCLKRAAQEIFSAIPVFRMPLEQEMVDRMGQNPNDIHNQIYNALFRDLDNRIRLRAPIALSGQKQIAIVNQCDENGLDTELYQSIKKNVSDDTNMIYFDSCDSNTIKILRFYSCGQENLL